jgi:hypothetical protein
VRAELQRKRKPRLLDLHASACPAAIIATQTKAPPPKRSPPPVRSPPPKKNPPPGKSSTSSKAWPPAPPGKQFVAGLLCYKQNTNFPIQTCDTVECPYGPYGEPRAAVHCSLIRWLGMGPHQRRWRHLDAAAGHCQPLPALHELTPWLVAMP